MRDFILVGVGGFFGAVCRYALAVGLARCFPSPAGSFPVATFTANIIGCFLIGVLFGFGESHESFSKAQKLLLMTGVLGGFTTFSSFGLETQQLINTGHIPVAATYVLLSILLGVFAVMLGSKCVGFG